MNRNRTIVSLDVHKDSIYLWYIFSNISYVQITVKKKSKMKILVVIARK